MFVNKIWWYPLTSISYIKELGSHVFGYVLILLSLLVCVS